LCSMTDVTETCLVKDTGMSSYDIIRLPFLTTPVQQKDWEGIGGKR
jgi:hypothetical protein